jgi:hypothetical protein
MANFIQLFVVLIEPDINNGLCKSNKMNELKEAGDFTVIHLGLKNWHTSCL